MNKPNITIYVGTGVVCYCTVCPKIHYELHYTCNMRNPELRNGWEPLLFKTIDEAKLWLKSQSWPDDRRSEFGLWEI